MYPDEALLARYQTEKDTYTKIIEDARLNDIRFFAIATSGVQIDVTDKRLSQCHDIVKTREKLIKRIASKYV